MTTWEYKIVRSYILDEGDLNKLGKLGWELTSVLKPSETSDAKLYYFKREVK